MVRVCALLMVIGTGSGCSSRPSGPPAAPACVAGDARPAGLLVAGSGAALPLARALAERWRRVFPQSGIHVPDSIGTSGAARALADGAIDIGLATRMLKDPERGGIRVVPLARSQVNVTAHPRGAPPLLSRAAVVDVFAGRLRAWPDGTPIVPLLREAGDSSYPLIAAAWPELHAAMTEGLRVERFTVCSTDQEMREAIAETEGAIGLLDTGIARQQGLPLRAVSIAASPPLIKPLLLLLPASPSAEADRFAEFARAPEQLELLTAGGYLAPEAP